MNKKVKKIPMKTLMPLIVAGVLIIVFFGTYYFYINKSSKGYEKNMKTIVNSINKLNHNVETFYSQNQFNPKNMSDEIWINVKQLNNLKNKLESIEVPHRNKTSYNHLYKGLSSNISMYNYIIVLLNDPTNKNSTKTIDNIKSSYKTCKQSYSLFSTNKISINISKTIHDLINQCINYSYDEFKNHRDSEISQNQLLEFSNKIEMTFKKFSTIKKDYFSLLNKTRSNEVTYDELSEIVNKDLESLKKLNRDLYSLSIPEKQINLYNSLKSLLNDYEEYAENFKYTLSIEKLKTKNNETNIENLNSLYNVANTKLSNVNIDYDNFSSLYEEFKKSIL